MPHGPLMIDLNGHDILPEEEIILKHPMVGGVILFFKNCRSVEQLHALISKIRTLRPEILIAVDREGGNVQRFQKAGFRSWPAARTYGDVYDLDPQSDFWKKFASLNGTGIGAELRGLDIDINLAPVLDSHSNSEVIGGLDRAFHADPMARTEIAKIFIEGMKSQGVKATGKHFPDHGVCEKDSHHTKPISDIDRDMLFEKNLLPYRELIKLGLLDVIMPAHITYTAVDPDNTAGFSKIWLNDILRDTLGFKGAIISDCLSMSGADIGDMKERALRALANGCCDMAIMCNQKRDHVLEVLNYLQANLNQDRNSQLRLAVLSRHEQKVHAEEPSRELRFSNSKRKTSMSDDENINEKKDKKDKLVFV